MNKDWSIKLLLCDKNLMCNFNLTHYIGNNIQKYSLFLYV